VALTYVSVLHARLEQVIVVPARRLPEERFQLLLRPACLPERLSHDSEDGKGVPVLSCEFDFRLRQSFKHGAGIMMLETVDMVISYLEGLLNHGGRHDTTI